MPEETVNQKTVTRLRKFTEDLENSNLPEFRALKIRADRARVIPGLDRGAMFEEPEEISMSMIDAAKAYLFILGAFGGLVLFFVGSLILMTWAMETLLP